MTNDTDSIASMRLPPLGINYGLVHDALLQGRTDLARRLARPLLKMGDASMEWYSGLMHHTGTGVSRNLWRAHDRYLFSAIEGFSIGYDGVTVVNAEVRGARVDLDLLKMPASLPVYSDITKLKCSPHDTDVVFWEFQRSANLGDVEMQILVGMCYEAGIHVPPRWEVALEWYRRAGSRGSERGVELYNSLSEAKLGERGEEGRYERAFGCEAAANSILKGPEPANDVDAFWWYYAAAEKDDVYACWQLSDCYLMGWGVERDLKEASTWSSCAIESEGSIAHAEYCYFLTAAEESRQDRKATLRYRRQMKLAMARPAVSGRPVSLGASPGPLDPSNDNGDFPRVDTTGA